MISMHSHKKINSGGSSKDTHYKKGIPIRFIKRKEGGSSETRYLKSQL